MSCAETSACPPDSCFRHGKVGDRVPWSSVEIHGKMNGRCDVNHVNQSVGGRRDDLRGDLLVGAKTSLRVGCHGRGCVIHVVTSGGPPDSVSRCAPRVLGSGTPRVVENDLHGKGGG